MKHELGNVYKIDTDGRYVLFQACESERDRDMTKIVLVSIDDLESLPWNSHSVKDAYNISDEDFSVLVGMANLVDGPEPFTWEFLGTIDIDSIKIKAPQS